eukprot:50288-Pelagomonas_calceolata.AAC.1
MPYKPTSPITTANVESRNPACQLANKEISNTFWSTSKITLKEKKKEKKKYSWAYTGGSCHIHNGKQENGAGVYCPLTDSRSFVEPDGAGVTNTICRAKLAAIAAAITHSYAHIASDCLTSLHQIRKQLIYPNTGALEQRAARNPPDPH